MGNLIRFRRKGKAKDEAARPLFPPFLSGTTDARAGAFRSDASASADGVRPGASPRPEVERKKIRKRRGAIAAFLIVFLGGTAAAFFGDHGYLDLTRQQRRHDELRAAHALRVKRVEALRREIDSLTDDPSAIERIAREDLGYVAKDEITLLLPGEDPGENPGEARGLDAKSGSGIVPAVRSTP